MNGHTHRRYRVYCVLAVATFVACQQAVTAPTTLSAVAETTASGGIGAKQSFSLALGGSVTLAEPPVVVTFDRVSSDSRCPIGTTCFWEGDATVVTVLADGERTAEVELHTHPNFPREARRGSRRIRLVELVPHPIDGQDLHSQDYVASFIVSKAG